MNKNTENWLQQSSYDFETARALRTSMRNVYAVYMCHLSIEKALKGLVFHLTDTIPPKTHSLILLLNKAGRKPAEELSRFVLQLNDASVATRYPEDFSQMLATYSNELTDSILLNTEKALEWIKTQF